MANKPLQSIKFPGLLDTYQVPQIASLAPAYSITSTYSIGDLVTYDNKLYKCTVAITTSEVWTPRHWTETSISDGQDKSVRFDIEQNKTEAEKKRARTNLGILYSESFNDAIRHFLEIVLRKSIYTEDITTIIDYLIGAINGIDGVSKNGDTLIIRYSINDPSQQNDVLSFEK